MALIDRGGLKMGLVVRGDLAANRPLTIRYP